MEKDIIKDKSKINKKFVKNSYASTVNKQSSVERVIYSKGKLKKRKCRNVIVRKQQSNQKPIQRVQANPTITFTKPAIHKPDNVFVKKPFSPKKISKRKTVSQIQNLGIKDEAKNQFKAAVLNVDAASAKALKTGGTAIKNIIKNCTDEAYKEDLTCKTANDMLKAAETVVNIEQTALTSVNTAINTVHNIVQIDKTITAAPKKLKSSSKFYKHRLKQSQRFIRMKKSKQCRFAKYQAKKGAPQVSKAIIAKCKDTAVWVSTAIFLYLIIIVVICGAVVAALGSVIWQTSSELDTTQIIKYISELDYDMQTEWYKGKTNIEIEKFNDKSEHSIKYHYLLAVDKPQDNLSNVLDDADINCMVKEGFNANGIELKPTYRGFNYEYSSCDELLEECRWTTDDYRAALAYLQIKNENLGWFSSMLGWAGEYQLKSAAKELHNLTHEQYIVIKNQHSDGTAEYRYEYPIYSTSYTDDDGNKDYFYFGRKYSVKYLIDKNIIKFDDNYETNEVIKERFYNIYNYGNLALGNLAFPLELNDSENISDRISKHFGKQLIITYTAPKSDADGNDVYGTVKKEAAYHYANDLSANAGDIIYSPINGLCKVSQHEGRGYEYTISTAYNSSSFDFSQNGYLVKISCSSASFIPTTLPKEIKQGEPLGIVADNISVNYTKPNKENDTENEDIFADKLFPCCTDTLYHNLGANDFTIPQPEQDHIHIELYKLPCDFTNVTDIEKNVLAPELFFDYSKEGD